MGTALLKKIAVKLEKKQNRLFTYPVEKQRKYVKHFPEPKNGIERGYFQYCCQMKLYGEPVHSLLNISALPLSLCYMQKYGKRNVEVMDSVDAIFFNDGKPFNIIPDSLLERYENIITLSAEDNCLNQEDKGFLCKVYKRYSFSWMLWLKMILKIAQYSAAITKYTPKAIISCSEFSFTAPILTEYCHSRGVKLINVMHGEKLYDMHDAFSKFDEFYVWNQEYIELLCSLRADSNQFRVEIPQALRLKKVDYNVRKFDYTYYLASESDEILLLISNTLMTLSESGKKISVRPHPRYSDVRTVRKLFTFANIENTSEVTIEQSLLQTGAAISLYSTVLNQALCNSIPVIIDDVSNPNHFNKLKELGYVCLNKEHQLLSRLLGGTI